MSTLYYIPAYQWSSVHQTITIVSWIVLPLQMPPPLFPPGYL